MSNATVTATPNLSVLIPTHGRGETLRGLLARLKEQTLASERFEVIVVDDGSPEPISLDGGDFDFEVVLIRQEQAGPGAARNRGLERCRAPLVLILNDDAVPALDLLERHLLAHAELGERCAVLGSFHFTARALRHPLVRLLDRSNLLFTFEGLAHGRTLDWGFFWTCNLSLPVAALREVGGFDAERFPQAIVEDVELGYRLGKKGWKVVYREDCHAEHDHVLTPQGYLRRAVELGRYLTRMWRKHGDPRIVWRASEAEAEKALAASVGCVEIYRSALPTLQRALEQLDAEYLDRPMSEGLTHKTIGMIGDVGLAAFHRGMHIEATGIDPLHLMESGAPAGGLTSIVIVSCDALDSTRRCIQALRDAREEAHPIELLVVDNGSSDGSAEWLAQQHDLRLIRNPENHGAPRARNQAIALCRGDWIAFLDNDVFVPPGWLGRALYHGAVDPGVGAIPLVANRASKHQQVPYAGGDDAQSIAGAAEARFQELGRRGLDCELFTSLAVLVRREVIERIGGFDERFSPWGFEDDDLALRIRCAGWRNRVALDTFVYHAPYPDEKKHRRHEAWLQDNWEVFASKWGPGSFVPRLFDYEALDLETVEERGREWRVPLPAPDAAPPSWRKEQDGEKESASSRDGSHRERHNVLVLGSGRSGTSLLAGTLANAGWFPGHKPYPAREANPKGFYETSEINGLNEYLLARSLRTHPPLGAMQGWLAVAETPLEPDVPPHIEARMACLVERTPFVFKDPRFAYTLPAWRKAIGDARFVCVFRDPAATAASLLRECAQADYLSDVEIDFERAVEIWSAMYGQILAHHRHEGQWLFLHYDELLTKEGLDRLESFVGAPVARDFPEARLSRSRAERPVGARATALYRELCELAGRPLELRPESNALEASTQEAPELSVLVCTYQRLETLKKCLASFERQNAAGRFELVVVNDGSTDGTREWLEGWRPRVPTRIVQRENGGLAAARNSGLAVARGGLVLLVNDDTLAHPDLVEAHLAAHAEHGPALAVLGTFEQPPAALDNALMRVLEDDTLVFCFSQLKPGERHDWNAFWTCNVSVSAEDVRAVGGFDESFRRYGCEDTDLAYRLYRERGVEVLYEPRARAHHEHLLDFEGLARRNRTVGRAWMRMFRKHPETLRHEYWIRFAGRTRASLDAQLVEALPERALREASARELARVDLGALERSSSGGRRLAAQIVRTLRADLKALNELWWSEGQLEGLTEFGVDSIRALGQAGSASEGANLEPWPLASQAHDRLLAWPRYDRPDDLERLLETWAEALLDQPDRCLCLRHDPEHDGDLATAVASLKTVYERVIGTEREMEVLMIDGPIAERDLPRLGRAVRGVLAVPGRTDALREVWAKKVGARALHDPALL